jgi:hypothetical protein
MHAETEAYNKWAAGEGKTALDHRTLNIPDNFAQYLHNRIDRAFQAGIDAGRKLEREELQAHAAKLLFGR